MAFIIASFFWQDVEKRFVRGFFNSVNRKCDFRLTDKINDLKNGL